MLKSVHSVLEELPDKDERETSMMLVQSWVAAMSRTMHKNINDASIQSLERRIIMVDDQEVVVAFELSLIHI